MKTSEHFEFGQIVFSLKERLQLTIGPHIFHKLNSFSSVFVLFFIYFSTKMGRGRGHKGGRRVFSNPHQVDEEKERQEKARAWRAKRGEIESDSDEEEGQEKSGSEEGSSGEASDSDGGGDEPGERKVKGPQDLIEINNPNRIVKKPVKNVDLAAVEEGAATVELSRREREEIEKERAKEHYARLTAEGKTDQAKADLARLAIIRKQREEAAKKKEEEKRMKEAAKAGAASSKMAAVKSVSAEVTQASTGTKFKSKRK